MDITSEITKMTENLKHVDRENTENAWTTFEDALNDELKESIPTNHNKEKVIYKHIC